MNIHVKKIIIILSCLLCFVQGQVYANTLKVKHQFTDKQVKALQTLNKASINKQNKSTMIKKNIHITISQLKDSQGNIYLGAIINKATLSLYLTQLEQYLLDDFTDYREHQAKRDHQLFHLTVVNPIEYKVINKNLLNKVLDINSIQNNQTGINVTLLGLGSVKKNSKATYFIVAQSDDGQLIRQKLLLKNKDFHVTLGFKPSDIYGVSKGVETLLPQFQNNIF